MLNIVHFSYVPNTASTNRLLSYLNNIPENRNVRVWFLMPDSKKSKVDDLPHNIEVIYCWERFRVIFKLIKPLIYRQSLKFVRQNLQKGDIVYSYNVPLFINNLYKDGVRYYGERTESPEVTTSHSCLIPFSLERHLELCRKLDGMFVISTALRDYYISHGVDKNKIHIINMVVDPARFDNVVKIESDHKYIAYCGNASNTKDGLDKLIKAFSYVCKDYSDLMLYIIGPCNNRDNNVNIQLVEDLGIKDRVYFTGNLPAEQIPQILKNSMICALARPDSLQSKCGFPTKLGEYLLTENPVVVTNVGDISLFLKDQESAFISSPNYEDFANKLRFVLQNPELAQLVGRKGCRVALEHFNAKTEIEKMLNVMHL